MTCYKMYELFMYELKIVLLDTCSAKFNYLLSERRRVNFFHIQNGNYISQKLFQNFLC